MNDHDNASAKRIFFEFSCNKSKMYREGVLSTYENYGISAEIEEKWIIEFISRLILEIKNRNKTSAHFHQFVQVANHDRFIDCFFLFSSLMEEKLNEYDALSKVIILGALLNIKKRDENKKIYECIISLIEKYYLSLLQVDSYSIAASYQAYEIPPSLNNEKKIKDRFVELERRVKNLEFYYKHSNS